MSKNKIKLREAMEQILSDCISEDSALTASSNLEAIITHWLQCPEKPPITGSFRDSAKWKKVIQDMGGDVDDIHFGVPFPPPDQPKFTFIDLFAGIGGFRQALQSLGGKCVFSSEWDRAAKQTYFRNYGEIPFGDIHEFTAEEISDARIRKTIPKHTVLAAGFPCQPFSRAGVSARDSLGQSHGFSCEIQGTLFFDIVRIAKALKPDVLILENVTNLKSHDGGNTFKKIEDTIRNDLGYTFTDTIIDSSSVVPQRRKRCYMVCFKQKKHEGFKIPELVGDPLPLSSILDPNPPEKYTISDRLWEGHKNRTKRNLDRGVGFTAFEADITKPSKTIVARYGKDGKECLIGQKGKNPRKLTPEECAKLMGFPPEFRIPDAATPAYKQFGNSVVIPVIEHIAEAVLKELGRNK